MTCKKQCLDKIQNKYKCVLSNLINEATITTSPTQLTNLGKDIASQKITIFSNLMHTERALISSLVNLDKLQQLIPSLVPYAFSVGPNIGIIYTLKIGPSPANDYYLVYNNNGKIERLKISDTTILDNIKLALYNLITRNTNIDSFRITSGKQLFSGCVSTFNDLTTDAFKELFYNFSGLNKYCVLVSSYNDKYGLKYSTGTYYN